MPAVRIIHIGLFPTSWSSEHISVDVARLGESIPSSGLPGRPRSGKCSILLQSVLTLNDCLPSLVGTGDYSHTQWPFFVCWQLVQILFMLLNAWTPEDVGGTEPVHNGATQVDDPSSKSPAVGTRPAIHASY